MSEQTVVGDRRNVKAPEDLEIVGPRRDVTKPKEMPDDDIELSIAAPRKSVDGPAPKRRRRSARSSWRRFSFLVAATSVMVVLTLAAFFLLERYQPVGDALIDDQPFSATFEGWEQQGEVTFEPGEPWQVILDNEDPNGRTYLRRTIDLPPGMTLAYLQATMAAENVVGGRNLWQRARVYLAQLDEAGKPDWSQSHNLFRTRGTKSTRTISQVFPIPASVDQAQLALNLNNATGRMIISDLKLYPVEEQSGFRLVAIGLMAAWAALALTAAIMTFKNIPSTKVRLGLGFMLGFFAFGLFMPAPLRDALIVGLHIPSGGEEGIEPDMIGHGIVFAIMACLVRIGRPGDAIWLHVGCWALIAVASEVLQLFTLDRQPSVVDFAVDGIGVILGLTLAAFLPRLFPGLTQTSG